MTRFVRAIALTLTAALTSAVGAKQPAGSGAVLKGTVLTDTARHPIADVDVEIVALKLHTATNDKGEFRLEGIAPGGHHVVVRRLGYLSYERTIEFVDTQTVERTIYLEHIASLDTVNVADKLTRSDKGDPEMAVFNENRNHGFGTFFTRDSLAKHEGQSLGSILKQYGARIIYGHEGQQWVLSQRPVATTTMCPHFNSARSNVDPAGFRAAGTCLRREGYYLPDSAEAFAEGMPLACWPVVYESRVLMNRLREPFDLAREPVDHLEAVEWYSSQSQTPPMYLGERASCGVLVLHSRRS